MSRHGKLLIRFERLEASRKALLDSLAELDAERLRQPSASGGWSILQILGHVRLAEEHSLSYVRRKMQDRAAIPRADLRSLGRLAVLTVVMRSPLRFKAPTQVASPSNEGSLVAARAAWDAERQRWRELVETFPPELLEHAVYRHPFVGRMKLLHCLGFMSEHFRHHRKQIERLR